MTALEFRSNAASLTAAQAIVQNPAFVQMLEIVTQDSPAVERPNQADMNPSNLAFLAGRCHQHMLTIKQLKDLAVPVIKPKSLVPTFEDPLQPA